MDYKIIAPIIIAPIITAFVGLVFSKYGVSGKIKQLEFYIKKKELIEKLLATKRLKSNQLKLENELEEIATYINVSSISANEFTVFDYKNKKRYYKVFNLPKSITIGGKVAAVVYYIYGITSILYIPLIIYILIEHGFGEYTALFFIGFGISFVVALLCRNIVINAAQRNLIVEKAKREIFLNDNLTTSKHWQ